MKLVFATRNWMLKVFCFMLTLSFIVISCNDINKSEDVLKQKTDVSEKTNAGTSAPTTPEKTPTTTETENLPTTEIESNNTEDENDNSIEDENNNQKDSAQSAIENNPLLTENQLQLGSVTFTLNKDGTATAEGIVDSWYYKETYTPNPELSTMKITDSGTLYDVLTAGEKQVYHAYFDAAQGDGGSTKYGFWPPVTKDEFQNAYNSFINDYPEFFDIAGHYGFNNIGDYVIYTEIKSLSKSSTEFTSRVSDIENSVQKIIKDVEEKVTKSGNTSPENYLHTIFTILDRYIKYDHKADGFWIGTDGHAHTIYGPLVEKKGVCEGYAKTYAYVAQQMGFGDYVATLVGKSWASTSRGVSHVWNAVKINGTWKQIDLTWNQWLSSFSIHEHELTGSSATWWEMSKSQ